MNDIYSLRIYDTELVRFSMEKRGLEDLVAEVLSVQKDKSHLMPLDLEMTDKGIAYGLEHRVIPIFRDAGSGGLYWRGSKQRSVHHLPRVDYKWSDSQSVVIFRWRNMALALQGRHQRCVQHRAGIPTMFLMRRYAPR